MTVRLGIAVIVLIILTAVFAPWLAPHDPVQTNVLSRFVPPAWVGDGSWDYPLGTDELGRDILSRLIWGSRVSLLVGTIAVGIAGPLGVLIGLLAGYFGGRLELVLMRWADIQLSIPAVLFAIAVVAVLGQGFWNVVIVLGINGWMPYARLVRGQVMAIKEKEYVESARAIGARWPRILFRHIMPNAVPPAIVIATFAVANTMILEATLSFLGLGVELPTPTWGNMLSGGRSYIDTAWWLALFPGLAIFVTVLGVNLVGDFCRDRLDPTVQARL